MLANSDMVTGLEPHPPHTHTHKNVSLRPYKPSKTLLFLV